MHKHVPDCEVDIASSPEEWMWRSFNYCPFCGLPEEEW